MIDENYTSPARAVDVFFSSSVVHVLDGDQRVVVVTIRRIIDLGVRSNGVVVDDDDNDDNESVDAADADATDFGCQQPTTFLPLSVDIRRALRTALQATPGPLFRPQASACIMNQTLCAVAKTIERIRGQRNRQRRMKETPNGALLDCFITYK